MCFKNLPIEFDANGQAQLEGGWEFEPVGPPDNDKLEEALRRGAQIQSFDVDPVTRVAGALSFHTEVDLRNREVVSARTEANLFRGYEVILKGRDPLDAIHISSRACGVCGGVHATCAAMALEMAFRVVPPPLAIVARNLGQAAELMYDHTLHLFLLAGPDYSEAVVSKTNGYLWAKAQQAEAWSAAKYSTEERPLKTVADIMRGLNPLKGHLYREALDITRAAREIASLMMGKYPHPSTIFPGGLGIEGSNDVFAEVLARIVRLLDYAKKVAAIWDDLMDFFLEGDRDYHQLGARPTNLICTGIWDDPEAYDARYAHCSEWGEKRLATPGAIVNGQLCTTRLAELNLGIEEFVDHSYYKHWEGHRFQTDPLGAPLSPYHPWNKQTKPDPQKRNWKEKYTWGTAPRWDRESMEAGPLARHWITAMAGKLENEFIWAAPDLAPRGGLQINVPAGQTPEILLEWKIPQQPNTLERNRARAYHIAYCGMVAFTYLLEAFKYLRLGKTKMSTPSPMTANNARGVGFWEGGRGTLTHYIEVEKGKIANYQIVTPSTWMASPRDPFGVPGPYEQAMLNTPLLEEFDRPEDFTGIDILRTIRSFDPCMPCTVHMYDGDRVMHRDATSCACGLEA